MQKRLVEWFQNQFIKTEKIIKGIESRNRL